MESGPLDGIPNGNECVHPLVVRHWEIDIPAQGEDEVSIVYDIIENGIEVVCGTAIGTLVFMGAPCDDGSWMVQKVVPGNNGTSTNRGSH